MAATLHQLREQCTCGTLGAAMLRSCQKVTGAVTVLMWPQPPDCCSKRGQDVQGMHSVTVTTMGQPRMRRGQLLYC